MVTSRSRKRPRSRRFVHHVAKPAGVLHPRVQKVGPDHFGIVCFDCGKAGSKFLLADFYGNVLIPPTKVAHNQPALEAAVAQVHQAFAERQLRDGLLAIERTGRYHRVVQRAFAAAHFETRIVHPFVTKQYRQPVDPGNKTDDADLAALHRATVTGCALQEAVRDEAWTSLWSAPRFLVHPKWESHQRSLICLGVHLRGSCPCRPRSHSSL
jgi:transposase